MIRLTPAVAVCLLAAGLVATSCASGGSSGPPEIGSVSYMTADSGSFVSVTPDAATVLVAAGDAICLRPVGSASVDCTPMPGPGSASQPAGGWAGDSSRFVFHDRRATATEFTSSVWSFDPTTGTVDMVPGIGDIAAFDLAVSTDGSEVALSGTSRDAAGRGTFVISSDGALRKVTDVAALAIEWLPDSDGLVLSSVLGDDEGLWVIDLEDGAERLVLGSDDRLGAPVLAAVSPDGSRALVYWRELVAKEFFPSGISHYSIVSLDTGDTEALKAASGDGDFVGPGAAAFSPDGEKVAYTYRRGDSEGPLVLAVRPSSGGREEIVAADLFTTAGAPSPAENLFFDGEPVAVWAADTLVLRSRSWALAVTFT